MSGSVYELASQIVAGTASDPSGHGNESYYCLSFARHVVDKALGVNSYGLGGLNPPPSYITANIAKDAWTNAGFSVNTILPGDLLFQPYQNDGHVAIDMGVAADGVHYVLENVVADRGKHTPAGTKVRLTPFTEFGRVTTVIRFPTDRKDASVKPINVAGLTAGAATAATAAAPAGGVLQNIFSAIIAGDPRLLFKTPEGPEYSHEQPLWLYNTLEAYEGRQPVARATSTSSDLPFSHISNSLVVIRKPYADELDTAMPILGPFSIAVVNFQERLNIGWAKLKSYYLTSESWGRTYLPIQELGNTTAGSYRWPLPFVSNISVRQDAGVGAVGEVELHIGDQEEAEMILSTLAMIQRYKNALVEIWLPVSVYDKVNGGERMVVVPAMTGMIDEVTASPYPHSIKIRILPQDQIMNLRGIDPDELPNSNFPEGTKLSDIISAISDQYKIKFFTPSALSIEELPGLQRQIGPGGYETMGRPPLDIVRELVERSGGLKMTPIFGTEVFGKQLLPFVPRAVYMIYDPLGYTPFTTGFWKNQLWDKLLSPLARLLLRGQGATGEVAVFYPIDLGRDPKYVKNMAAIFATYATDAARSNVFGAFIDKALTLASTFGLGGGTAVRAALDGQTQDALIELIDGWFPKEGGDRVIKYMAPVLNTEEFITRTPSASDLANPVFGTPVGAGQQRARRVSVDRAAKLMQVSQSPDGTFQLQTPTGPAVFNRQDDVMVYYSSSFGRPTLVTPIGGAAETDDNNIKFFPFTLTLSVLPSHGVRVGMVAVLVGFGRIDGCWEIQSVNRTLGRSDEMSVVLRTARDLFIV